MGWLGQLGSIVGDMLQGWGLLGALRGKGGGVGGTTSRTASSGGWSSFGGVGGGLGGYSSSPSSPMVGSRHQRQTSAAGEHIELVPLVAEVSLVWYYPLLQLVVVVGGVATWWCWGEWCGYLVVVV